MTKLIPIHNRKREIVANAIVDDADFDWLSKFNWFRSIRSVATSIDGKNIEMHNLIMRPPAGLEVDHIDGNTINNQRSNLRCCTHAQNLANRRKQKNGKTSQYKGVSLAKNDNKWRVMLGHKYIGYFTSETEAARAYDAAAITHYGEFARLNFPQEQSV